MQDVYSGHQNLPWCEVCLVSTHHTKECNQRDVNEDDFKGRLRNMEERCRICSQPEMQYNFQGKSAGNGHNVRHVH